MYQLWVEAVHIDVGVNTKAKNPYVMGLHKRIDFNFKEKK